MKKTDFWGFAKRALWVPIVYFGVKGCFDSACTEAQELYEINPVEQGELYKPLPLMEDTLDVKLDSIHDYNN